MRNTTHRSFTEHGKKRNSAPLGNNTNTITLPSDQKKEKKKKESTTEKKIILFNLLSIS